MKKRLPLLLLPVLALILEALPYGAVLQFGRRPQRRSGSCTPILISRRSAMRILRRSLRHLAPASCWSCWRCTPRPESGDLQPQRRSQRASAPSSRSVRSCWASGIIPLPVRSSRPPCWRNASGWAAYGDRRKKTPKTSRRDEENQTSPLCQCGEGGLLCAMERIQ